MGHPPEPGRSPDDPDPMPPASEAESSWLVPRVHPDDPGPKTDREEFAKMTG